MFSSHNSCKSFTSSLSHSWAAFRFIIFVGLVVTISDVQSQKFCLAHAIARTRPSPSSKILKRNFFLNSNETKICSQQQQQQQALSYFLSCGESSLQVGKLELSLSHSLLQLVFHSAAALAAASTAAVSATASTYEVSECLEHTSITEISKVIYQNVVESWTLTIDDTQKIS